MAQISRLCDVVHRYGRTQTYAKGAIAIDEGCAPYPGIDASGEPEQTPAAIVNGIFVVDKIIQPGTVKADVFDADFLEVLIFAYGPVMRVVDIGVQGFVEANSIALYFGNAVLFSHLNSIGQHGRPDGFCRVGCEKFRDGCSAVHIERNPLTGKESGSIGYCDVEGFSSGTFRNGRQGSIACVAGLKNEHIGRCPQLFGIEWRHVVHLADNCASAPATASPEDDIAVADVDGLVVVRIGIDEKFARGKEDNAPVILLGCGNGEHDSCLVGKAIVGDSAISCDVEYVALDIGNGFVKVVIARVGKVG